jgi:iron complex transport system substrate-binding protein
VVLSALAPAFQAARPDRIISLVPALTEMLFAIGAGPQVVAVSSYDDFPPEVNALPKVGALVDPDLERIFALKPDLVLTYGSQTDLQGQLTRAGIAFFDYRHGGMADVTATMRALGARTGHAGEADEAARRIEARVAAVLARSKGRARPRAMLVFGRERRALRNIYVSGGRGFLHDMLEAAGADNVFADIERESVQATTELILTRAPDVILEMHRSLQPGIETDLEVESWQALASVPAVKNRRVIMVSGSELPVPGPRIADALEKFEKALRP